MSLNHPRQAALQDIISKLQSQITDLQTLLPLLCFPLSSVNLLPPQFRRFNSLSSKDVPVDVARVFPPIQRALLESVLPTWETILDEEGCSALSLQYFCPDAFSNAAAADVALCAYSTILSLPLHQRSVDLLLRLTKKYPIDKLFRAVCTIRDPARRSVTWDDCLRNIFAAPTKIANTFKGQGIPDDLGMPDYFNNLSIRTELIIHALSELAVPEDLTLVTQLFSKLVHIGAFPSSLHPSPSQSSFFHSVVPSLRRRLQDRENESYRKLWNRTIASLPSVLTQQAVLASLFSSLTSLGSTLGASARDRGIIRWEAVLLCDVVGNIGPDDDLWNTLISVILARSWGENHSRVFVCWLASSTHSSQAQEAFLHRLVDAWSASDHIKHSLLSRHQYLSTLLLLVVTHFPQSSNEVASIALSPSLVSAVGGYISHPDASVRRCGMLVAEVVASRVDKNLNFDDWEGDDDGKVWARRLRQLCSQRDIDFEPSHEDDGVQGDDAEPGPSPATEVTLMTAARQPIAETRVADYDSDDSLTGYASPSSSRSPSPTPSELQEIEKDPTLHVGRKKIPRPVYLAQLGELVRNSGVVSSEENQEADRIEMAINMGEELIRRKHDYGTELAENAANLVYGFVSLSNKFDLDDFDNKIQRITIALVACCPKTSAQCMIEEFFKNQYSSTQRSVMLNALALGARELASLPITSQALQQLATQRTTFPSKMLPPVLHQKYLGTSSDNVLRPLLEDITKAAIDKSKEVTADKVPEVVRERQLRIRRPPKITEVASASHNISVPSSQRPPSAISFTNIAAEWFIIPFVNRFWVFLLDEQTREERTAQREALYQYRGAGTGLILNPLVLSAFLNTMAILVHASQNAPQWLALIAPNTLELAVTIGSRQITRPVSEDLDDDGDDSPKDSKSKEASVLTSSLNVALIVLDGCLELDGGRSLGLEHTALLIGTGEWAGQVFNMLERGIQVTGVGGIHEVELQRATAGVLLKVDQITSKWRRSMVGVS
ncbi:telomere length regulation protein-domain-containing protein [Boletus edulis BED1]|uniref:Telomere length regulation protein-domain-containing protein n=1 Tax=Boletus edulis BED1 TaxID=1328754 RepID=A0AAD4GJU6_BOLED|nr:telomere length regulation protein-domain-containing protein [Boletus edulis BED1]